METVSNGWKANQEQNLTSEAFIDIEFDIADPAGYDDATILNNGNASFSDSSNILNRKVNVPVKYATLERNLFLLDKSLVIPPSLNRSGFVSSFLSRNDLSFSTNPTLTISFSSGHYQVIKQMSITWGNAYGNEFAREFKVYVTSISGVETLISHVTNNTFVTSVIKEEISQYTRIRIVVIKWSLPQRRARISNVFLGVPLAFDRTNIVKYNSHRIVNPLLDISSIQEITFSVDMLMGSLIQIILIVISLT